MALVRAVHSVVQPLNLPNAARFWKKIFRLALAGTVRPLSFTAQPLTPAATVSRSRTPTRTDRDYVVVCEVDEFLKAGGGCRCLTLALDVTLGPNRPSAA